MAVNVGDVTVSDNIKLVQFVAEKQFDNIYYRFIIKFCILWPMNSA